nr:thioredoxin domain-containing protein [Propionicimonas sp.]
MSSSRPSTNSSSPDRRETLRRQREAADAASRRTRHVIRAAWIAGLAVIALMLGVTVWSVARPGQTGGATGALVVPAGATDAGAVVLGDRAATVTVSIYADFMCPYCGQFERANGADLANAVSSGKAKLEIHPMSFLDPQSSGTRYSTRAANAFVTIANADPGHALDFYRVLYENQPAEGSSGLSDAQLVAFAQQVGVPASVTADFGRQSWVPWVQKITDQAWDSGIKGTPTVKINGEVFGGDVYTAGPLARAIEDAASA